MNKNKIRKAAHKAISKERKGHQEFFDTFRKKNKVKQVNATEPACKPFNFEFQDSKILHQINLDAKKGTIKTILYTT